MPTYEYECQKCGHTFDKFQSMTDQPLKRCPECRGKLKKLFGTGAGLIFKGSGFYQTDYRSSEYQSSSEKEKSAGKAITSESSSTKTETKKADKKPAKAKTGADKT